MADWLGLASSTCADPGEFSEGTMQGYVVIVDSLVDGPGERGAVSIKAWSEPVAVRVAAVFESWPASVGGLVQRNLRLLLRQPEER
jgi:hypothetical protein